MLDAWCGGAQDPRPQRGGGCAATDRDSSAYAKIKILKIFKQNQVPARHSCEDPKTRAKSINMPQPPALTAPHPAASRPEFWDQKSPRCGISRMSEGYAETFLRTRQIEPTLFDMNEDELSEDLASRDESPSQVTGILRMKFWLEYERASGDDTHFYMQNVYDGVCGETSFRGIIRNPYKLAWILCPPINYLAVLDEMLQLGLKRRREALAKDPSKTCVKGGFDTKLAELQHKITLSLEERKHGAVAQKIEQTTRELSVQAKLDVPASEVQNILENMSPDQVRAELEERRKRKAAIEVKAE